MNGDNGRLQSFSPTPIPALVTTALPIQRGTAAYYRTTTALVAAGFSTFALMYCVQPLLPALAASFAVSAAAASLAVSVTTGALSVTLLVGGTVSARVPRKTLIVASLVATSALTLVSVTADTWAWFLLYRALAGIAFAGLPAIAMAYIGEELSPDASGLAMGLYVAGTAVGGMSGRLLASALTDVFGWRAAVGATGILGVLAAVAVSVLLPPAAEARRGPRATNELLHSYLRLFANPALRRVLALGFLFMGVFVAVYNYLTFLLVAPPYELGHTAIGSVFLLYLVGMVSSPWAGARASARGRRRTMTTSLWVMFLGTALTWLPWMSTIILGVGLITFGFFAAHAVASSWAGHLAAGRQAQAASLYIVCYYIGASVTGTLAGVFWTTYGWTGVVGLALAQTGLALLVARTTQPN